MSSWLPSLRRPPFRPMCRWSSPRCYEHIRPINISADSRSLAAARTASAGLDVLVEPEEVGRVVDSLESRKPLVVALAVGCAHTALALVPEEVDVHAPVGVRLHRVEEVPRPGDVAVPF